MENHAHFMSHALRLARIAAEQNEIPVGAVVVKGSSIIGKGYNRIEQLKDPTAHAELIAITAACDAIGGKHLHGCTLYVTLEPCAMCSGALVLARPARLVFGAMDPKAGGSGSIFNITQHRSLNHQMDVIQGVLEKECSEVLTDYFNRIRQRSKDAS
jgi:tRNA(adenine34) deaminase